MSKLLALTIEPSHESWEVPSRLVAAFLVLESGTDRGPTDQAKPQDPTKPGLSVWGLKPRKVTTTPSRDQKLQDVADISLEGLQ